MATIGAMETETEKIGFRQPYNYRYIQKLRALEAQLAEFDAEQSMSVHSTRQRKIKASIIMIYVFVDKAAGRKPEDAVEAIRESV